MAKAKAGLVKNWVYPGKPKKSRQGDGNGTKYAASSRAMHVNPTEDKGGKCIH